MKTLVVIFVGVSFMAFNSHSEEFLKKADSENLMKGSEKSGADSSGGGVGKGNELADFYRENGVTEFNYSEEPYYQEIVTPILDNLANTVPGFLTEIKKVFLKKWKLDPKDFPCERVATIYGKDILGCQTNREVRLNEKWLKNPDVSARHKAGLITHELVQGPRHAKIKLDPKEQIDYDAVMDINNLLHRNPFPSEEELQMELKGGNFGLYMTKKMIDTIQKKANDLRGEIKNEVCPLPKRQKMLTFEHYSPSFRIFDNTNTNLSNSLGKAQDLYNSREQAYVDNTDSADYLLQNEIDEITDELFSFLGSLIQASSDGDLESVNRVWLSPLPKLEKFCSQQV